VSGDSVADRVHRNLMEVNALLTEQSAGGIVEWEGGELVFLDAHPLPLLSGVMRETGGPAGKLIARADALFAERGRGWTAYVRPDDSELERAAAEAGLQKVMDYPEMVCRERLPVPEPPVGVELRRVTDAEQASDYWSVCGRAYVSLGFPPDVFDSWPDLFELNNVAGWVAYDGGEPVTTAMVVVTGIVGMVAWVATLETSRGRGLAALCTVRATNAAFERGAELASLQASPMGHSLYRRLGYEDLFDYGLYVRAPASG
jgi:GNAT superfamily N-acetyltransferase